VLPKVHLAVPAMVHSSQQRWCSDHTRMQYTLMTHRCLFRRQPTQCPHTLKTGDVKGLQPATPCSATTCIQYVLAQACHVDANFVISLLSSVLAHAQDTPSHVCACMLALQHMPVRNLASSAGAAELHPPLHDGATCAHT
jgi:hypothetical protein